MATQPSSSTARMSDGTDNNLTIDPIVELNYVVTQLCQIVGIETDGENLLSHSFVESVLEHVKQALVKNIRSPEAKRRSFINRIPKEGYSKTRAPAHACHSNGHDKFSEFSQIPPTENNELVVEPAQVDTMPVLSPEVHCLNLPISHSTTAAMPPTLAGPRDKSGIPPWNDLEGAQSRNEIGTNVVVNDPLFTELIQPPPPSSSPPRTLKKKQCNNVRKKKAFTHHDKKNSRKSKPQLSRKKLHIPQVRNGSYRCTCGTPFLSLETLKHHIKFKNSVWKFKCEKCPKKFYDLSSLKQHLAKKHEMVNPLKEYVIGCTRCGIKFKTKCEFSQHRKDEHPFNKRPRRRRGKSLRRAETQTRRPDMTLEQQEPDSAPQHPILMTPLDVDPFVNEKITPQHDSNDEDERQIHMLPEDLEMSQEEQNVDTDDTRNKVGHNDMDIEIDQKDVVLLEDNMQSQENDDDNMSVEASLPYSQHNDHDSNGNDLVSNALRLSGILTDPLVTIDEQEKQTKTSTQPHSSTQQADDCFSYSQMDQQGEHEIDNTSTEIPPPENSEIEVEQHDIGMDMQSQEKDTDNKSIEAPPPNGQQVDYQQRPNVIINGTQRESAMETLPQSSRQTNDCPLPPQMTDEQVNQKSGRKSDPRGKAGRKEDSVSIHWYFCPKNNTLIYLCLTCLNDKFSDANQLREHLCLKYSARKVTCFKCKFVFGSCESFLRHGKQCLIEIGSSHPHLQREQIRKKMEEAERKMKTHYKIPRINHRSQKPEVSQSESANFSVQTAPHSSEQIGDCPSPPRISNQGHHDPEEVMNANEKDNAGSLQGLSEPFDSNSFKFYRYRCVICNEAFISFSGSHTNIRKHMRFKHNSESEDIKCEICGLIFNSCRSFDQHWDSVNQ